MERDDFYIFAKALGDKYHECSRLDSYRSSADKSSAWQTKRKIYSRWAFDIHSTCECFISWKEETGNPDFFDHWLCNEILRFQHYERCFRQSYERTGDRFYYSCVETSRNEGDRYSRVQRLLLKKFV